MKNQLGYQLFYIKQIFNETETLNKFQTLFQRNFKRGSSEMCVSTMF